MKIDKVVVLGLDGATYQVLDRFFDWGILPNLDLVFNQAKRGSLLSSLPPITGTAWTSFATGANPGRHGCFSFFLPGRTINDFKIASSLDIETKTFYELLEEQGKKSILINLPISWPPRLKKGVTIGSFLTNQRSFYAPKDLIKRVPELADYPLFVDALAEASGSDQAYVERLRRLEELRHQTAKKLFKQDWDFFFFLFSSIDWLQHHCFKDLIDKSLKKDSFLTALFKDVDNYVGWFLKNLPENTVVLILSDHGFKLYSGRFYLNRWLEKQGCLKLQADFRRVFGKAPAGAKTNQSVKETSSPQAYAEKKLKAEVGQGRLLGLVNRLALLVVRQPWLYQFFGFLARLVNRILPGVMEKGLIDISDLGLSFKTDSTLAGAPLGSFGQIYFNRVSRFDQGRLKKKEAAKLEKELINKLKKLKEPKSQKPAVKAVYQRQQVYTGPAAQRGPEIIVEPGEFWLKPSLASKRIFLNKEIACHDRQGVLAVFKKGLPKGRLAPAKLEDLGPTILDLLAVEAPENMDGRIIKF